MKGKFMRGTVFVLAGTAAVLGLVTLVVHMSRTQDLVGDPARQATLALADFDYGDYDRLLQSYVDEEGLVAYAKWKASPDDMQALDDFLQRMSRVDLEGNETQTDVLAFWINAYNALTLKGILEVYPTTSIRNHTPLVGKNIWKDLLLWVDGKHYSLDDIEHRVLRKLGEPRIHFALVCAARGCPPLRNRAYRSNQLEEQLDDNARRFFARRMNFHTEADFRTVHISSLFDWYGSDFAETPEAQVRLLRKYFPQQEKLSWLDDPDLVVVYLEYDWGLNDQETK